MSESYDIPCRNCGSRGDTDCCSEWCLAELERQRDLEKEESDEEHGEEEEVDQP